MKNGLKILVFMLFVFFLTFISASALSVRVVPLNDSNVRQISKSFNYVFNFTTDYNCSNVDSVVLSHNENITTDTYGEQIISIDTSSINKIIPYICEYRNGTLRKIHNASDEFFNNVYGSKANFTNYYGNGGFLSGLFNKTHILGFSYYNLTSFDINDYYLKSNPFSFINITTFTYTHLSNFTNDGIFVTNNTFNRTVDCSDLVGGSDTDFCSDNATSNTITHLSNLTDDVFGNDTIARVGNCSTGQFIQNITTGGIFCATPSGSGGNNTEQMQDAVGGGFNSSLIYDDAGDTLSLNLTYLKNIFNAIYQPIGSYLTSAVELLGVGNSYLSINSSSGSVEVSFNETKLNETTNASIDLRVDSTFVDGLFVDDLTTDQDSNLTEDDVEAYIFDDDNTANITIGTYCIINQSGGGSICHNGTGWLITG